MEPEGLIGEAEGALEKGDYEGAEALYRQALEEDPDSFAAMEGLLLISSEPREDAGNQELQSLLEKIERLAELPEPDEAVLRDAVARLRELAGTDVGEQGLTATERYNLAKVLRGARLFAEAIDFYTDIFSYASEDPLCVRALIQYGAVCLSELGEPKKARNALLNAQSMLEGHEQADELRPVVERGLTRAQDAMAEAEAAVEAEAGPVDVEPIEVEVVEEDPVVSVATPTPSSAAGPVDIFALGGRLVSESGDGAQPPAAAPARPPSTAPPANQARPMPPGVGRPAPSVLGRPPTGEVPHQPPAVGPPTPSNIEPNSWPGVPPPNVEPVSYAIGDMDSLRAEMEESGIYPSPNQLRPESFTNRRYRLRPITPLRFTDRGLLYRYDDGRNEGVLTWQRLRFLHAGRLMDGVTPGVNDDEAMLVADLIVEAQVGDDSLEIKAMRFDASGVDFATLLGTAEASPQASLVKMMRLLNQRARAARLLFPPQVAASGSLPTYMKTEHYVTFIMGQVLRHAAQQA